MSLFQAREWWSHPSDAADEYAPGGLCVIADTHTRDGSETSVHDAGDTPHGGEDCIVTGSLGGVLRVWKPRASQSSGASSVVGASSSTHANIQDLLLEERMGAPILQVLSGRFSSIASGHTLAVLHPHKLMVLNVTGDVKTALKAARLYEHVFSSMGGGGSFSAACMCAGAFGSGAPVNLFPRDSIAVQSMDGQLAVFEQERFAFRRALDGAYLLPSLCAFAYVPRTDSLLLATSDMCVESFKFSALAAAWSQDPHASGPAAGGRSSEESKLGGASSAPARRLVPDWSINLGEHVHTILVGGRFLSSHNFGSISAANLPSASALSTSAPLSMSSNDIVVVGERSLFVLRDTGVTAAAAPLGAPPATGASSSPAASSSSPASAFAAGAMRLQKRHPYPPAAACLFVRTGVASASHPSTFASLSTSGAPGGSHHTLGLLLATHNPALHVYAEENLLWAARMPYAPITVAVGRFAGLGGLIISLSARGDVTVSYLGTDPPTGSITGGDTIRDLDYAGMDAEHKKLLATIKEVQASAAGGDRGTALQKQLQEGLLLRVGTVPTALDEPSSHGATGGMQIGAASMGSGTYFDDDEWGADERVGEWGDVNPTSMPRPQPTLTATVSFQFVPPTSSSAAGAVATSARNVHVAVHAPSWVLLPPRLRSFTVPEIGTAGATLRLPMRCSRHGVPVGTQIRVVAQYHVGRGRPTDDEDADSSGPGELRSAAVEFAVPLCLAVRVIPPVKSAAFKFTLDTNRPPPPLTELFADMLHQPRAWLPPDSVPRIAATGAAVMSFLYRCGADVSILVSKAGGRYRVQAGSLEALCLVAQALAERLTRFYSTGPGADSSQPPFQVTYTEPLPLVDYFNVIEQHFAARTALLRTYSVLNDRAHEYRLVTKRLLVRAKDRAPPPLSGLDLLLDTVHKHVTEAVAAVLAAQDALTHAASRLGVCNSLLASLVSWKAGMDARSHDLLLRALTPSVTDSLECGWEEATDAALTAYLRALTRTHGRGGVGAAAAVDAGAPLATAVMAEDVAASASVSGGGIPSLASAAVAAAVSSSHMHMHADTTRLRAHITSIAAALTDPGRPQVGQALAQAVLGAATV